MKIPAHIRIIILYIPALVLLHSCKENIFQDTHTAYFGGEVINPNTRYVLFCKDNAVIDTIPLKKDNTFFKKFDSLAPGLYTFKHDPEYQYVYFDKNDSLMVQINTKDFDESIVFCGRGDEKNNFLMEMYLRNEKDKDNLFVLFDSNFKTFDNSIYKTHQANKKVYNTKKEEINWGKDFDVYATAMVDLPYYTKKEIYPVIHKLRTGKNVADKLPNNYYNYRKNIDFSNESLTNFAPFIGYLNHMLENVASIKYHNHYSEIDLALKTSINKLNIADTLIKNQKVKNTILNNIAFQYLLEDQNIVNNKAFLDIYHKYSTDKSQKNEIIKIGNAIQSLTIGKVIPEVSLIDKEGKIVSSNDLIKKNTVFFFWTKNANSHMIAGHKKIIELKKRYPNYDFVAINLNDSNEDWEKTLSEYNFKDLKEYKCADFEDLKSKWAITKIHRIIVVNKDRTIKNAFANIFELHFEDNLIKN